MQVKKREVIQAIIDDEPEPWIIMKPSRKNPADPDPLCVFENPAEGTQAQVEIPRSGSKIASSRKSSWPFSKASGTRRANCKVGECDL